MYLVHSCNKEIKNKRTVVVQEQGLNSFCSHLEKQYWSSHTTAHLGEDVAIAFCQEVIYNSCEGSIMPKAAKKSCDAS